MRFAYIVELPFNLHDKTGRVTGCDIELARIVFHRLGVCDVSFVQTEFADLLPGLARGDWQMTTGLFATDERRARALFSRPIWALPDGLLMRSALAPRISGYRDLAADDALTLAVIRDQVQQINARNLGILPDRIHVFETYAEAAQAVRTGNVSAYASVARAHDGFLQQNPGCDMASVIVPEAEQPAAHGCFGFARTDVALCRAVNEVLEGFVGGAEHRKLMAGFGFCDADVDRAKQGA